MKSKLIRLGILGVMGNRRQILVNAATPIAAQVNLAVYLPLESGHVIILTNNSVAHLLHLNQI